MNSSLAATKWNHRVAHLRTTAWDVCQEKPFQQPLQALWFVVPSSMQHAEVLEAAAAVVALVEPRSFHC
jgi:hypothetical protein